jgi:hypothetical protein
MADVKDLQAWASNKAGEEQGEQQNAQGNEQGKGDGKEQDDITPVEAVQGAMMEAREAADYLDRAIAKMDEPGDLQKQADELRKLADDLEAKADELTKAAEEDGGDEDDVDDETEVGK